MCSDKHSLSLVKLKSAAELALSESVSSQQHRLATLLSMRVLEHEHSFASVYARLTDADATISSDIQKSAPGKMVSLYERKDRGRAPAHDDGAAW